MATNTLNDRSSGETIEDTFFNDIHQAMNGDFVGRNTSGVPTSGQNLGTAALPWGTLRANGLVVGGSSVDVSQVSAPPYRVISGRTRSTSTQPSYIDPAGSGNGASLTVQGASTSLVFDVNGASFTLSSDIALGSLSVAPSTNNTCDVNDTDATGQDDTRIWGEENPFATKKEIVIDNVGSEITSKDGKLAAFKGTTEIFLARVDTSNNRLHKCLRGHFFDDSDLPIKRETLSNNDTLTLLNLGWVFLDSDLATVDVSYNEPVFSVTAPSSPATGDYWYDLDNNLVKRYDGAVFQTVTRTLIGMIVLDDTDALAARSANFDRQFKSDNNLELEIQSTEIVRAKRKYARINVNGVEVNFGNSRQDWNITTDLAAAADMYAASEQASTYYGVYLKENGGVAISDIEPYVSDELGGLYHPHNPWRFMGEFFNDGSSDITKLADEVRIKGTFKIHTTSGTGSGGNGMIFTTVLTDTDTTIERSTDGTDGDSFKIRRDGTYSAVLSSRGDDEFTIGKNTANRNVNPDAIPVAELFSFAFGSERTSSNVARNSCTGTEVLEAGDVLHAHGSNSATTSDDSVGMAIQRHDICH